MKKTIGFIFLLMVGFTVQAQEKKEIQCEKFHTGKFKLFDRKINSIIIIERDENFQTEKVLKTGTVTKTKVEWIDDCTYMLDYIESTDEIVQNSNHENKLKIEIISTDDNSYTFKATMKGADLIYFDELTKIE